MKHLIFALLLTLYVVAFSMWATTYAAALMIRVWVIAHGRDSG